MSAVFHKILFNLKTLKTQTNSAVYILLAFITYSLLQPRLLCNLSISESTFRFCQLLPVPIKTYRNYLFKPVSNPMWWQHDFIREPNLSRGKDRRVDTFENLLYIKCT